MAMERSASEPAGVVLNDSDYYMPCHGVGDTGHAKRVQLGPFSKDDGTHSSRINQIKKQAAKYPGPGKYIAHTDWTGGWGIHGGNKFQNGSRDYKPLHKFPDPRHYESKDIVAKVSNASKDNLSKNPRVIHGRVPKGKLRSFLDQAIRHGSGVPAPGHYYSEKQVLMNKTEPKVTKMTEWTKEMVKTPSRGKKVSEIGPDHYHPSWTQAEDKSITFTVPKEEASNFLDKAVREKMVDRGAKGVRPALPVPGPGQYNLQNFDLNKTSRGTYHIQLRGMTRNAASGYF